LQDTHLNGPLPLELTGTPLRVFWWQWTGLCAPVDDAFQRWLESIDDHEGGADCPPGSTGSG